MLLGQTGRGWQAKGGKVASLQHVRWDGKTVAPQIVAMLATPTGFRVDFTQPLGNGVSDEILQLGVVAGVVDVSRCAGLRLARAGSARRGTTRVDRVSADRKSISVTLASTEQTDRCIRARPRACIT